MLQVPQRTPAANHRLVGKVVAGRRRRRGPFQGPGIPGIVAGQLAFEVRAHQIVNEDEDGDRLNKRADGDDHVPYRPVMTGLIGVDLTRHPKQSRRYA